MTFWVTLRPPGVSSWRCGVLVYVGGCSGPVGHSYNFSDWIFVLLSKLCNFKSAKMSSVIC